MMELMPGAKASASALSAEKLRMDIIAQNIANAHVTRGEDGKPYQRKVVMFEEVMQKMQPARDTRGTAQNVPVAVKVTGVVNDTSPGHLVYDPAHPHADPKGFVRMPNVKPQREMVDLISSSRAYEANLTVIKTARTMAQRAMSISGR